MIGQRIYDGVISFRDPLSTKVDIDVHVIKLSRSSSPPSIFAFCKQSEPGQWEGLGTRLYGT